MPKINQHSELEIELLKASYNQSQRNTQYLKHNKRCDLQTKNKDCQASSAPQWVRHSCQVAQTHHRGGRAAVKTPTGDTPRPATRWEAWPRLLLSFTRFPPPTQVTWLNFPALGFSPEPMPMPVVTWGVCQQVGVCAAQTHLLPYLSSNFLKF